MQNSLFKALFLFFYIFLPLKKGIAQQKTSEGWWKNTSIYQIYPRSFMDSNDDGVGDIQGIISKLDYIKKLGFETIWISPFFSSPQRDFGYDISDYYSIDRIFGTMQDVEQLIAEIHRRKMYVVFDLVLNHTSDQHLWFQASIEKKQGKGDWYIWKKGRGKRPPTNWKSLTGPNGWHFNEKRGEWYWASFLSFQPDLNWRNPEVKKAMFDVVRFWLKKGVDGFRLDIFNVIFEDSEFRNNPKKLNPFPTDNNPAAGFQRLKYSMNHSDNYELAKELRKLIDEYEHLRRFVIGEVFGRHEEIRHFLGNGSDGLNLIFLFDMKRFKFNAKFFGGQIEKYEKYYHSPYVPVYVYSNHDDKRSMSRIDGAVEKAKLLALFQLTARGVAVTYQGEEFGMSDTKIPRKEALDPLAALYKLPQFVVDRLPLLINRDECRTPMQWDSTANAGFCNANIKPWLPVNNNHITVNAVNALADSASLLCTYRQLLELRKSNDCIKYGDIQVIKPKWLPAKVLAFVRKYNNEELLVLINFSKKAYVLPVPEKYSQIIYDTHSQKHNTTGKFNLLPFQGLIFTKE